VFTGYFCAPTTDGYHFYFTWDTSSLVVFSEEGTELFKNVERAAGSTSTAIVLDENTLYTWRSAWVNNDAMASYRIEIEDDTDLLRQDLPGEFMWSPQRLRSGVNNLRVGTFSVPD